MIKKVILTDNYFYIASRKYNIDNSSTTTIEKYNISDNRLLESVESDSIGDFQDIISAGMDRFIVSSSGNINVLTIADNKLNIAASFTPGSQYNAFELVFKNNTLHLLSWDRVFYSYSISDSNQESLISRTPLYDFLADSSNFSQFKWSDDKLIALSGNEGIIEFVFNNEVISDIKSAYNQSGELMKGTFAGDYYLLPRSNRVDVINVADIENITLHKQTQQSTDQITTHQGAYLLNGGYSMGLYELSDEQELIQQSSVNFANHSYLVNSVQSEKYIYSLDQLNDGIYLSRYNISTPDSIYETPIQLPISGYCCGFNTSMEIKNGEVLVYDSVKNGIHIFTDIENDNFSYKQFVSYPEGYTTAASLNGIIYIASKDKLTSYTLSSTNELVALDNVELSFGTELIELRAVGNSLIIQTPNELFLYELTVIEKPTLLVSFLIKNNELMNAVFQFMDNKLVATTRQSIQFYQINKAPTPLVNKITLDEDSTLESASIFTDAEADMITLTVTEQSTNGTVSVDENGLTYTPNNNFNGEDTVTIKATDIHVIS